MSKDVRVNYRDIGNWSLNTTKTVNDDGSSTADTQTIIMCTLCVIRDNLIEINRKLSALECPNFVAIPHTLKRISRNTAKPRVRKQKAIGKPKLRVVR